jgi:hypothetical protein
VVDATAEPDEVSRRIIEAVERRLHVVGNRYSVPDRPTTQRVASDA